MVKMKEQIPSWLELIQLDETDSTSNQLKLHTQVKEMTVLIAEYQTAGRGQRGNSWESERGANLAFSILTAPKGVNASHQFILSQAISLAILETLKDYHCDFRIKWPNDIYWHDKKMGGILIENELMGKRIDRCIIGIGLNINQKEFISNAPNPISLSQITEKRENREQILLALLNRFHAYLEQIAQGIIQPIIEDYHQALYRNDGFYPYRDEKGIFLARIDHVEPQGVICLKDEKGDFRYYAFKEIKTILKDIELPN